MTLMVVVITPKAKASLDALPVATKAFVVEALERLEKSPSLAGLHVDSNGLARVAAGDRVLVFRVHRGLALVSIDAAQGGH